ncbi:MAG TPA: TRAP transporter substrate-binding protein [Pseudolabrys sp.]|nr:TRAP transporter substrate-binding protein [Pseudolabrys sp.]
MVKSIATTLAAALVLLPCAATQAQTTWHVPTNYAESAFHTRNLVQFAKDVEAATGGSLQLVIHPGGKMVKHADIAPAVRDGRVPAGEILISILAKEAPVYGLDSVPFLATGYDDARKLYAVQRPFLERQLAKEGLMLLFSVPWPPQGIYAKREISSLDDLKGLRFRSYNPMTRRIAELAGAIPTQIEIPDLPAAFKTGLIDVMITSASSGVQSKAEDYLTHYIDTQAWLPRNMVFANAAAFAKLSPAEQQAVRDAAKAAEARGWALSIEEMTVKTQALKDAGIKVLPATPQLRAGLAKIGETIAAEWAVSAGADGQAMLAAYGR